MQIFEYKTIDSTNLEAKRLVDSHSIQNKALISAKVQTAGRGRLQRSWASPEGNFAASFVFHLNWVKVVQLLPAIASIAVRNAIIPNENIYFKWPNDVLVLHKKEPKKCCGILIETYKTFCIVGVGINILTKPNIQNTIYKTTTLQESDLQLKTKEEIFENILSLIRANASKVIPLWQKHNFFAGKQVSIQGQSGTFIGLDNNFNAILNCSGKEISFLFGDLK